MKKISFALIFILCFLSVFSQTVCKPKKPWSYRNVVWYSEEPKIEIIKSEKYDWQGYLAVDGEKVAISLLWGPTCTFEIIDFSKDDGNTAMSEIRLISGRVEYNKNNAILIIKEDKVYNNEYSKIVLNRKNYEE